MPPPSTSLGSAGAITRESLSRLCQQLLDASLSPTSDKHVLLIGEIQSLRLAPRLLKEAAHKEILFSEYMCRLRKRMELFFTTYEKEAFASRMFSSLARRSALHEPSDPTRMNGIWTAT
mmetsp:Transcript_46855/g.112609  ORF Transcript_46855/g.112609 Transcript_46855/m.112609 type:complete len:119 (-) Transcript_46855:481-837(-)